MGNQFRFGIKRYLYNKEKYGDRCTRNLMIYYKSFMASSRKIPLLRKSIVLTSATLQSSRSYSEKRQICVQAWPIDQVGERATIVWISFQQIHACLSWGVSHTAMFQSYFYTRGCTNGWKGARWCGWNQHAGSCNYTVAPPFLPPSLLSRCTRPDRHLRQLSRRRLTNWLLNYWATWPVIASYLTSSLVYRILDLAVRKESTARIPPSCSLSLSLSLSLPSY